MNVDDESDFVFACLLGAYIRSLRQQNFHQQPHVTVIGEDLRAEAALAPERGEVLYVLALPSLLALI